MLTGAQCIDAVTELRGRLFGVRLPGETGMVTTTAELDLDDGTPVRFILTPTGGSGTLPEDDRPAGMGRAAPVAAGGRSVANLAGDALRGVLRPVSALLQEVHEAVTATPQPPTEITVTFGVEVGQDLKLGVVGGNGKAHLTVTACWKPVSVPGADAASATE